MYIEEKYCKVLELDKILKELAQLTCCEYAYNKAINLKPFTAYSIVKDENTKTNDALILSSKFGTPTFSNLKNPQEYLKIAKAGGMLSLRNFLNISEILRQARMLLEWYKQCEGVNNSLNEIFSNLEPNTQLEKKIKSIVISDELIDDFASDELAEIRRKIKSKQAKAKQSIDKIIRSSKYQKALQENIVTIRDGRFVIPVKAEYKSEIQGLVHDTSSSGATLFVEPMSVVEANNEIKVLQIKEKQEIERILYELSAICSENSDNIINNFEVSIILNIYFAKANLAINMNATMPNIVTDGTIILNKARHPLIDKNTVVPIDISLGEKYKTLVVTGPNTGGKTVTLKTIGLLTLMTMSGLLIPVSDDSTISIFKNILVDIGDEQSIEQSLSTFSSHMTNIISILKKADTKSLVLVDELGSGTDPIEGAAIAISILQKLKEKGCITAATTHYSELKTYAIETENVENACCEFDVKTLKPTYRLLIGVPGKSNAFAISKKLGLEEDVLEYAQGLISNEDKNLETVIENLEKSRQEYEEKYKEYNQKLFEFNTRFKSIEEQKNKLEQEKTQIIENARDKARKIVENVKLQSEVIIKELDEIKKQKESDEFLSKLSGVKSNVRGKVDALHSQANPVNKRSNDGYKLPRKLKVGDSVLVYDIDKKGVVCEISKDEQTAQVRIGILKSRVKISNLRLIEEKNPYKPNTKVMRTISKHAVKSGANEIDLRGQTVEEALMEVDLFIDRSLMSHLDLITIIHGKGTGALRKAIHSHLKSHKNVKSYRLGVFGEGEAGVTIVELK